MAPWGFEIRKLAVSNRQLLKFSPVILADTAVRIKNNRL